MKESRNTVIDWVKNDSQTSARGGKDDDLDLSVSCDFGDI